jgi:hypothetical protein
MEFQNMLLIIMGIGFIIFGLGVIFLPEVKEKGEFKDNREEEKEKKKKKLVFFGDNIYAFSRFTQGSLITLKGMHQMPANFYIQSGALVALEDNLTETKLTTDLQSATTNIL